MTAYRDTALGFLGIESDGEHITRVFLNPPRPGSGCEAEVPVIREAFRQLEAYAQGELKAFDLPLAPHGTPFMRCVWDALLCIPYGATASYRDIAESVGSPKAYRAVGMANHRNPIPIFIPCHRVIGKDGTLTGYAGGLEMKRRLLETESR